MCWFWWFSCLQNKPQTPFSVIFINFISKSNHLHYEHKQLRYLYPEWYAQTVLVGPKQTAWTWFALCHYSTRRWQRDRYQSREFAILFAQDNEIPAETSTRRALTDHTILRYICTVRRAPQNSHKNSVFCCFVQIIWIYFIKLNYRKKMKKK